MSIKYAILGLLHRKDLHGYRIKQLIERDFGTMWTVNYGQIYPTLQKMRDEALLTMKEIPRPNSPPRKLYSITKKGKDEFVVWLNSQPEKQMIIRDPFLLRFPFFDLGDKDIAVHIIRQQIDLYQRQIDERMQHLSQRSRQNQYASLVSELGLELNQTMLRWLNRTSEELQSSKPVKPMAKNKHVVIADSSLD